MKKLLILTCTLVVAIIASTTTARAQVKVGTVDMDKIFKNYYKTKDAEARINEARAAAKKEIEDRMDTYKASMDEINKLNDELQKPELSADKKADLSKTRDEKIAEFKSLDRELKDFQATREKQLQEQAVRMRNGIVDEITKLVMDKVKSENYDYVLDKSGVSMNGVPVILYARDSSDFSDEIITALNKTKGKDTGAAASSTPTPKPSSNNKP